jgi:hypothetical protein
MKDKPGPSEPNKGDNPFEDSEAQLDSIMGELEHEEPLLDPGDTRRLPEDHYLKEKFDSARKHMDESTFIDDLQAAHEGPMYDQGTVINDRFQIIKQLGAGGMGAVYLANDLRLKDQKALKMMLPGLVMSTEAQNRFILEIKALQRLAHPGIVRVFDYGRDSRTGSCFFSMEYVGGTTLAELLKRRGGRLTVEETVDIVLQLLDVLTYAHADLVHRDLKPLNIMLRPNGKILVLDFGLAKMMSPGQLTQSSMVLGTVYYQSPEQSIRPGEVDKRSDLYSVGVIMYQLLTGEVPVGHIHPPSKLNKAVGRKLDQVIMRCLESQREDRYQTAEELAAALRHIVRPRRSVGRLVGIAVLLIALSLAALFLVPDTRPWANAQWERIAALVEGGPASETAEEESSVPPVELEEPVPTPTGPPEEMVALHDSTRDAFDLFMAESIPAQWAAEARRTVEESWARVDGYWEEKEFAAMKNACGTLAEGIATARDSAREIQSTWEARLQGARERAEAAAGSATSLVSDGQEPTADLSTAEEFLRNAEDAFAAQRWAEAEQDFISADTEFRVLAKQIELARTMADVKARFTERDQAASTAREEARKVRAHEHVASQFKAADDALNLARNAVAEGKSEDAEAAYQTALDGFLKTRDESQRIIVAAKAALAKREAAAMAKKEPAVTSGSSPIVDETEGTKKAAPPGGLTVSPASLILRSIDDAVQTRVYLGGKPVRPEQIQGYRFKEHERVSPMFRVEGLPQPPGTVRIVPSPEGIQPGAYTLQILGGGQTVDLRLTFQIGAPRPTGTNVIERINITFPTSYTTGQYIRIPLEAQAGRRFVWKRDGKVVAEGKDRSTLEIVAERAGTFTLGVEEFSGSELRATWSGPYKIADEKAVLVETERGKVMRFSSASGFGSFGNVEWSMGGNVLARSAEFSHLFDTAGTYEVVCHGTKPAPGEKMAFRRLRYRVTVR